MIRTHKYSIPLTYNAVCGKIRMTQQSAIPVPLQSRPLRSDLRRDINTLNATRIYKKIPVRSRALVLWHIDGSEVNNYTVSNCKLLWLERKV